MNPPLIAVVVPVYQCATHLPACLAALAAQSLADFACFLVDDGSTDGSAPLCEDFCVQDPRFRLLRLPHRGVSAARAAGVQAGLEAGASWFAFCDADDLYHPKFLGTLLAAAQAQGLPLACCRYAGFTGAPPAAAAPPTGCRPLPHPDHMDALLHDHRVDYSLCNKLYAATLLSPALLDNGFAFNEDLLANWQIFGGAPGLAFCDFVGYYYRQHGDSASHRPLAPESIDEQRRAAVFIREHAPRELQQSANAFYYEKLVYLASLILRRQDAARYRAQLGELGVGISAGLKDPHLGRNPRLPRTVRLAAWATVRCPGLWRWACRRFLRDRQA